MYQRCNADTTGFEPRRLYLLVVFLLYDKDFTGRISIDGTLDVLYMIKGSEGLESEIKVIFGITNTDSMAIGKDGKELSIDYNDYLGRQQEQLLAMRAEKEFKTVIGAKKLQNMFTGKELSTRIKAERQKHLELLGLA